MIGPALGSIDLAYLTRMLGADPHLLSYVDTVSVHVYMRLDPNTCPIGEVRCIRTLLSLRSLIDANGGSGAAIAITEGGYSGSNDATRPNNVVTEALQASWGKSAIDWMRARPELKVNLYTPYNPLDKGLSYSGDDYSYWHDHLGAVRASDLAFKPWGLTYHNLVAQYSLQQTVDTEPPSVPANLNGASPVASAPKLTWDASSDNVGVTGYQVLRNGKQVASVTGTSYTDSVSGQGTYSYTVRALDAAGNISVVSAPATIVLSDTTAPERPRRADRRIADRKVAGAVVVGVERPGRSGERLHRLPRRRPGGNHHRDHLYGRRCGVRRTVRVHRRGEGHARKRLGAVRRPIRRLHRQHGAQQADRPGGHHPHRLLAEDHVERVGRHRRSGGRLPGVPSRRPDRLHRGDIVHRRDGGARRQPQLHGRGA